MSKDKLISLIIKKETYKDTKAYLIDLEGLKEDAVNASYLAIKQILTTDYNAEAKLYAVRFLKDAFEKGNPSFINQVERDILPILISISVDENDEKAHMKYAGSSYTKSEQLSKFKAIVSSLFRMVKECIIKWAEWIPDSNRKFVQALNEIAKKKVTLKFQWKYFRPQNQQIFKQNCQKNGVKINQNQVQSKAKVEKSSKKQVKDPLVMAIEASLQNVKATTSQKDLLKIENDFNEAINNYLENSQNFKEELVQQAFDEFQKLKKDAANRIKTVTAQKSKESVDIPKEKSVKKVQEAPQPLKQSIKQNQIIRQKPQVRNTQGKIQKKISNTASKQQIRDIPEQAKKKQVPMSKVQGSSMKTESQRIIRQASKKYQQQIKIPIVEEVKVPQTKISQAKVKSPRNAQQKLQNNFVQQVKKADPKPTITKQSKIPTSPKRGPIKFDQDQSPFQSLKQSVSAKQQSKYASKQSSHKKQARFDNSISKQDSQRINFSDEDSSEFSQEAAHRLQPRDFKKKSQLTPIRQETQRAMPEQSGNKSSLVGGSKSRLEQESFTNRQKKGAATHKLMEQNKILMERYQRLMREHQQQAQEKKLLLKEKQRLERQLHTKTQNEEKLIKKLKSSIPMEDYNRLRREFQQQRSKRENLIKQNIKIRNENQSLIEQLNQTRYRLKGNPQNQKSRQVIMQSHSNTLNCNANQTVAKVVAHAPIVKEDIDEDYIKNVTQSSNLHNLLSKVNLSLFKKNALSQSEIFYRDEYVSIMAKSRVYTQNNEQFVSTNLTFQFKSLKQKLSIIGSLEQAYGGSGRTIYSGIGSEIALQSFENHQSRKIPFLLPILYLNFLRQEQFSNEEFDDIYMIKSEHLIKSKVTQWNNQIIKQASDIHKLFKYCIINGDKVRFCLSEGINDQIFMAQFEILRNNKFLLRILPIPYTESMIGKAKELMQNIIFLIS